MNDYDLSPSMARLGMDATSVSALRGSLAALLRGATLVRQALSDDEEAEEEEEGEALPFSSCSSDSSDYYDAEESFSDFFENVTLSPQPVTPLTSQEMSLEESPEIVLIQKPDDFFDNAASSLQPPSPDLTLEIQQIEESFSDFMDSVTPSPQPTTPPPSPQTSETTSRETHNLLHQVQNQIGNIIIENKEITLSPSPVQPSAFLSLPTRVRRSSSLRMPASRNDDESPGTKKEVRFADALGLDLNQVRTYMNELPIVPKCAYLDLTASTWDLRTPNENTDRNTSMSLNWKLQLRQAFTLMGSAHSRLRRDKICLLKTDIQPAHHDCPSIRIDVLVLNIAYDKKVFARFTTNNWKNYQQVTGCWINGDEETDTFRLTVFVPKFRASDVLEVALCFQCNGIEHWDNNDGRNYIFRCVEVAS